MLSPLARQQSPCRSRHERGQQPFALHRHVHCHAHPQPRILTVVRLQVFGDALAVSLDFLSASCDGLMVCLLLLLLLLLSLWGCKPGCCRG